MTKATEKQISYAKDIHDCLGYELPKEQTKKAYSDWLNRHVGEYKRYVGEMMLQHEVEMGAIDARRNW